MDLIKDLPAQTQTSERESQAELVKGFRGAYASVYGLERYGAALKFYLGLNIGERKLLREHREGNSLDVAKRQGYGRMDFETFLTLVANFCPNRSGENTSDLMALLSEEVKTFPELERQKYLLMMKGDNNHGRKETRS